VTAAVELDAVGVAPDGVGSRDGGCEGATVGTLAE
jgi:hypothetical protein